MSTKTKIDKHPGWQLSRSEKGWYYLGDSARMFCTALINTYMTTFLIFQGVNMASLAGAIFIVKRGGGLYCLRVKENLVNRIGGLMMIKVNTPEVQAFETEHLNKLRALAPECMVLLKKNGDFPLNGPCKIALYGSGARETIKGGTGSGDVNVRHYVTVEEGLENAGFTVTTKAWIVIPYASGDFHTGTGEYHYTKGGKDTVVYHNGYNNYSAYLHGIMKYVGEPDTLLVTGFSAGGFATSLLADDVISRFPSAQNVTVCVDSALILYDGWHDSAADLWQSPKEISDRLTTNNIVLDSLTALYNKRGDSVKILFDCSYRDDTLQQYQSYIDNGKMDKTKELGDEFEKTLDEMVHGLKENIPGVGIYIWSFNEDKETHNTQHTILSSNVFDKLGNEKSVCEWIYDAVNGEVNTFGLGLLGEDQ